MNHQASHIKNHHTLSQDERDVLSGLRGQPYPDHLSPLAIQNVKMRLRSKGYITFGRAKLTQKADYLLNSISKRPETS